VQTTAADHGEAVSFKVVFKKTTHDVTFGLQQTAGELKDHLSKLTGVPVVMMKLMYKGEDCGAEVMCFLFRFDCSIWLV
jgi:hypothetical protein